MKHLLIIFSLLLTSVSWSKDVDYNDLVKRDGLYYEKFTNEPFTGKTTGRIQNNYMNGKFEGEWLEYHENGQLKIKRNYKDGKLEGESLWYHKNGQLESKGNFKEDEKEGEWLHYRSNGKLWRKYYYKEGKKDGKWTWYDIYGNLVKTELY